MAEAYIGQIKVVAFNFAPKNWALCQGQILSIAQNQALFSILGTTYGGNGIQTFALPDLRGRVPIGWGQGPSLPNVVLGEMAGSNATTLVTNNLPTHNHGVQVSSRNTATATSAAGNYMNGVAESGESLMSTGTNPTLLNPATLGLAGGGQPVSVRQPYLGINYIICLYGIFPSRA